MFRRQFLRDGVSALVLPSMARTTNRHGTDGGYEPLGRASLPAAKAVAVDDGGAVAYVAGGGGFAVVDLADPAAPSVVAAERDLLADRDGGPLRSADLSVSGDRLLVGGPKFAVPDAVWGVLLYDVSDPTAPERVAVRETDHANHNVTLDGTTAYLTGTGLETGPVVVYDVTGDSFEELTRWSIVDADPAWDDVGRLLRSCHDVTVRGDRAYAPHLEAGTWLLDVTDPAAPAAVGHLGPGPASVAAAETDSPEVALTELPGNAHSAVPTADRTVLAVAHEAWDHVQTRAVRGPGGVVLWDVADPAAPTTLARIPPPRPRDPTQSGPWTTAHNVDIVGDRLYSGWFQGGVQLHDIADPANPRRLAWWREPDEAAFWAARSADPGGFFVAPSTGRNGTRTALYTFPDRAGQQADPPSLTPTPSPSATPDRSTVNTTTATRAPSPVSTSGTTTEPAEGDADGFGVATALAGLGVGAWLARRRGD